MAKNNPELIGQLINSLDKNLKDSEQSMQIINKHLNNLLEINQSINHAIDNYTPSNTRKIAKYIDDNNEEFKKLIDDESLIKMRKQLNATKETLEALNKYYKDQYMKTVEEIRGGYR